MGKKKNCQSLLLLGKEDSKRIPEKVTYCFCSSLIENAGSKRKSTDAVAKSLNTFIATLNKITNKNTRLKKKIESIMFTRFCQVIWFNALDFVESYIKCI